MTSMLMGQASSKILWPLDLGVYQGSQGEKGVKGSGWGMGDPWRLPAIFVVLISAPASGL